MSEATVALAAGCLLQIAQGRLTQLDDGWLEQTHLEVAADPRCPQIVWPLPPGTQLVEQRAKARLGDGTKIRLGEERWERSEPQLDGTVHVTLHLPELLSGDRVVIDLARRWPAGSLSWRPGPARYWQAELRSADDTLQLQATGDVHRHPRLQRIWTSDPAPELAARVHTSEPTGDPQPPPGPPGDVQIEQRLVLQVPPGDPQLRLFPGGGSSLRTETFLQFPPSPRARAWVIPAPPGAQISLSATPKRAASLIDPDGVPRLRIEPFEGTVRVALGWEQPDAPTYGARPHDVTTLTVDAPGGTVVWEGEAWRLVEMHGRPVLPNRQVLIRALDRRFRSAALPEPGAPTSLRGQPPGWELAEQLRPTLLQRVAVGTWSADPLWPRRLIQARRTGAVTPTEAALIVWLYARQLRLDAHWALIRPADQGPGPEHAPSGFVHPIVGIGHEQQLRFIDPTCSVCAPFELPPWLEGASALGPGLTETPAPTQGRHRVAVRPSEVEWQLEGPPALLLRLWLDALPPQERDQALAERMGGPGATLVQAEGIDTPGAPIQALAQRGRGLLADPLRLPPPHPDGTVWLPWEGERQIAWLDGSRGNPVRSEATEAGTTDDPDTPETSGVGTGSNAASGTAPQAPPPPPGDDPSAPTGSSEAPPDAQREAGPPIHPAPAPLTLEAGPLTLQRVVHEGYLIERLTVTERRIQAADAARISEARRPPQAAPSPPASPEPEPE